MPQTKMAWDWYNWARAMARRGNKDIALGWIQVLDLPIACVEGIHQGISDYEYAMTIVARLREGGNDAKQI